MLLHEFLTRSASAFPDKEAVVRGPARVTYATLNENADAIAGLLWQEGIERGDRVCLLIGNSPEYIMAYFGVLKAGGIVVPLNDNNFSRGLIRIFQDCLPRFVITQQKSIGTLVDVISGMPFIQAVLSIAKRDSEPAHVHSISSDLHQGPPKIISFSEIQGGIAPFPCNTSLGADDVALILYTSGTTGHSKGVMLTHRNLVSNAQSIIKYLALTEKDSVMVVLPFYYSYGNSLLTTHIIVGGTMILENSFLFPNKILDRMAAEKVTGFSGVPSTFALFLNRSAIREYHFPNLRYITQAGGAMAANHALELKSLLPKTQIFIMYGQTEATARLSYLEPDVLVRKAGSVGKAIEGVTLSIRKKDGSDSSPGVVGEIVAEGDNIMKGYWENQEETNKVLKYGKLHTGDLAWKDDEGFIYIVGRESEMIKTSGHRISPKEIEEVILEIPNVYEVAVKGIKDNLLGEAVVAYVVVSNASNIEKDEILKHCKKNLPIYMIPKAIYFVDQLPKTDSGKIKKNEL